MIATDVDHRPNTLLDIFFGRAAASGDTEAFRYPVRGAAGSTAPDTPQPEEWRGLTWSEVAEQVTELAAGLIALGVAPQQRVAIASTTRIEWILADFAIMASGAATTTVYPTTTAEEGAFILADSGSRLLFAEDAEQVAKVLDRRGGLPELTAIVAFDPVEGVELPAGLRLLGLDELRELGRGHLAEHPDAVTEVVAKLRPDDLATLIYTSGTTGAPKGVRLTHDCWSYQAVAQMGVGLLQPDDSQYLWLPLSHVFGKTLLAGVVNAGVHTSVDGRVDRIIENLPIARPTFMVGVPRVFEKVYNGVAAKARAGGAAKYRIFRWAADVARRYAWAEQDSRATGRPVSPALRARHALADRLVYGQIKAAMGGRLRGFISGSAALAPEIAAFFAGVGTPVLEGYGLTESSAASTVNRLHNLHLGTVGEPLPGTEVRIAEDGEVLLRGPSIMAGYHGAPERTAEVLTADGWFHTGDIGEFTDGVLRITDRKKDLIKTSGGKYVAPSEIERRFIAMCPLASNVLVIGNNRNFCSALITLDEVELAAWAAQHCMEGRPYAEVAASEEVRASVQRRIDALNATLQRWQTIKKFAITPRELEIERGEITPSLKVKRPTVERSFADLIEEMYAGSREA